jgi:hypothetical protein
MSGCDTELCPYWTGQGCACAVLGIGDDHEDGPAAGGYIDHAVWDEACDPSLPEGVIELQDRDGKLWRYPLAEFPADGVQKWQANE